MNSPDTNTITKATKKTILSDLYDDIDVKKQDTNKTANHSPTALSPIKLKVLALCAQVSHAMTLTMNYAGV